MGCPSHLPWCMRRAWVAGVTIGKLLIAFSINCLNVVPNAYSHGLYIRTHKCKRWAQYGDTVASVPRATLWTEREPLFSHEVPPCFPQKKCTNSTILPVGWGSRNMVEGALNASANTACYWVRETIWCQVWLMWTSASSCGTQRDTAALAARTVKQARNLANLSACSSIST